MGEPGLRVHLVGQDFGGRLVTAAASSRPTGSLSTLTLLPVGGSYAWRPGAPHNLRADRFVRGHTDVHGPEIAHALSSAIAAS